MNDSDWYILFVRSQSEEKIVRAIKERLDIADAQPFVPMSAKMFSRKNEAPNTKRIWEKEARICFPGYVFIDTRKDAAEFSREIAPVVKRIDGVYKFLDYGDKGHAMVSKNERLLLESLMDGDKFIDTSKGVWENGRIKITEGPLVGLEKYIKKVNANKRTALVEFELMGEAKLVTVVLEVVVGE